MAGRWGMSQGVDLRAKLFHPEAAACGSLLWGRERADSFKAVSRTGKGQFNDADGSGGVHMSEGHNSRGTKFPAHIPRKVPWKSESKGTRDQHQVLGGENWTFKDGEREVLQGPSQRSRWRERRDLREAELSVLDLLPTDCCLQASVTRQRRSLYLAIEKNLYWITTPW